MNDDALEFDASRWQATASCPVWLCKALASLGFMRPVTDDELLSEYLDFDFSEEELNDALEEACLQAESRGRNGRAKPL